MTKKVTIVGLMYPKLVMANEITKQCKKESDLEKYCQHYFGEGYYDLPTELIRTLERLYNIGGLNMEGLE